MRHLSDDAVVTVAEVGGSDAERGHAAACERCRARVASCEHALAALASHARPDADLPAGLRRWALAYAATAAPVRPRSRLLELLAGGAPLAGAVRGAAPAQAALYGDDAFHLDLRFEADGPRGRLHGQVVALDGGDQAGWKVAAVSADGSCHLATSDGHGMFWLADVAASAGLTIVAERELERLVVARVALAGPVAGEA